MVIKDWQADKGHPARSWPELGSTEWEMVDEYYILSPITGLLHRTARIPLRTRGIKAGE